MKHQKSLTKNQKFSEIFHFHPKIDIYGGFHTSMRKIKILAEIEDFRTKLNFKLKLNNSYRIIKL